MKLNFDKARAKVTGPLTQQQVDNLNLIMSEIKEQKVTLLGHAAYILATAWHESKLVPVIEEGGERYLKSKPYYPYFGRGFVQLTHRDNYVKEGRRLNIDFISNPDLLLRPDIAANILVVGMRDGRFTGVKLANYISRTKTDFLGARAIVNLKDKASLIAGYASGFLYSLEPDEEEIKLATNKI